MCNPRNKVLHKMEINAKQNCFLTSKDQKENIVNNPKPRLINPAKNENGRISKAIIDSINMELCNKPKFNRWKNTASVINWFKFLENKHS